MSARHLEFEAALVGWLAFSPQGRLAFSQSWVPDVLEHAGANAAVSILLQHGPGALEMRLADLVIERKLEEQEAKEAARWARSAPPTDDVYMLEIAIPYLRRRARAIHAEQISLADVGWDDNLVTAADAQLKERLAATEERSANGFTAAGLSAALSPEASVDMFTIPGYVGLMFKSRLTRGAVVSIQAQPKAGKSAVLVRLAVAAMRVGHRVLHVSISDMGETESAMRIVQCECGRNAQPYPEGRRFIPVPCCTKALVGCAENRYTTEGYRPLNPPVNAAYLNETEPEAILQAFPSFRPCTLCRGTSLYSPGVWWEKCTTQPMDSEEAVKHLESIIACGEYGKVETLFYPARGVTVSNLQALVDQRQDDPVDVLVVDYADMMGYEGGHVGKKWEGLQSVWEDLRGLAKERNILILTATQGNRSGGRAQTQDSTTVAGTRASIDNCTLALSLNQTPQERARGILRLGVVAARVGSFAPEHQAMCISRMDIQDPFSDSWHTWVKAEKDENK